MIANMLSPVIVLFCFLAAAVWYSVLTWYSRWRRTDERTIHPLYQKQVEAFKVETRELGSLKKRSTLYVNPYEVEKQPNGFYLSEVDELLPETQKEANVEHTLHDQDPQLGLDHADQVYTIPVEPAPKYQSEQAVLFCDICYEAFETQGLLNDHRKRRHIARYECSVCQPPQLFNLNADLARHNTARHPNGSEVKYYCTVPQCKNPGKPWTRKDHLKRHMSVCERAANGSA